MRCRVHFPFRRPSERAGRMHYCHNTIAIAGKKSRANLSRKLKFLGSASGLRLPRRPAWPDGSSFPPRTGPGGLPRQRSCTRRRNRTRAALQLGWRAIAARRSGWHDDLMCPSPRQQRAAWAAFCPPERQAPPGDRPPPGMPVVSPRCWRPPHPPTVRTSQPLPAASRTH